MMGPVSSDSCDLGTYGVEFEGQLSKVWTPFDSWSPMDERGDEFLGLHNKTLFSLRPGTVGLRREEG